MVCVPAAAAPRSLAEAARAGAGAAVDLRRRVRRSRRHRRSAYQRDLVDGRRQHRDPAARAQHEPDSSPHMPGLTASFVPGAADVPAGRVAVVAASGGVNHALAFLLTEAGHGVSLAVGIGQRRRRRRPDVLDHLERRRRHTAPSPCTSSPSPTGRRLVEAVRRLAAPGSRSSRSSSAATTSARSPPPTPARWRPPGAPPARRSPRPERFSSTTSANSSTPSARCRRSALRPHRRPRGRRGHRPGRTRAARCSTTCAGGAPAFRS